MLNDFRNLELGKKVKFTTYGAIGGTVSWEGTVVSHHTGVSLPSNSNAQINHDNIWTSLPTETQNKYLDGYSSYNYITLQLSESTVIIGLPWIDRNTLTESRSQIIVIRAYYPYDNDSLAREAIDLAGLKIIDTNITNM